MMSTLLPGQFFPLLETDRLLLRATTAEDIPQLLEIITYDGRYAETVEDGLALLDKIQRDYQAGQGINWCMVCKSSRQPIGFIGYYRGFAGQSGEVGFILKASMRRQGFLSEALDAVIAFGFASLGLIRVMAYTEMTNVAARAVLEKSGFGFCSEDASGYAVYQRVKRT